MHIEVSEELQNDINSKVLKFLSDKSAHSDIADTLINAVKPLGDVQVYCPDPEEYRYIVVSTKGVIFGIADGMHAIAFRLDPEFKEKALVTGGKIHPELQNNWVWINSFTGDWPQVDFPFWARKSYLAAREGLSL